MFHYQMDQCEEYLQELTDPIVLLSFVATALGFWTSVVDSTCLIHKKFSLYKKISLFTTEIPAAEQQEPLATCILSDEMFI